MGTSWSLPYVDVVFRFRGFESEGIPGYTVVEAVFTYLDWKTSSMVGKVCVFVGCLCIIPAQLHIKLFGRIGMLVLRAAERKSGLCQRPLHPSRLLGSPDQTTRREHVVYTW